MYDHSAIRLDASAAVKPFDFEALSALARSDPPAFSRQREELIRHLISNTPGKTPVLYRLQMQIDANRFRHGPGLPACRCLTTDIAELLRILAAVLTELQQDLEFVAAIHSGKDSRAPDPGTAISPKKH